MKIFKSKSIGIDISDYNIEIVELKKSGKKNIVHSKSRIKLEPGIVKAGIIEDEEKLSQKLKDAFKGAQPEPIKCEEAIFGLPEIQTFIHIFEIPKLSKKEKNIMIEQEAWRSIPLEKENLTYYYKIISSRKDAENNKKEEILLVAADQNVISSWFNFFRKNKIKIKFDIESLALHRGVLPPQHKQIIAMIDVGARNTNLSIFDNLGLHYSDSVSIAGNKFTEVIAASKKIETEKAEKIKIEKGLASKDNEQALLPLLKQITKRLEESFHDFEKNTQKKIQGAVLLGGSSKMKGFREYLSKALGLPTKLGAAHLLQNHIPLEFAGAIGLASKRIENNFLHSTEDNFDIKRIQKNIKKNKSDEKTRASQDKIDETEDMEADYGEGEDSLEDERSKKKQKKQIIIFLSILIIGAIMLGVAFWYRKQSKQPVTPVQQDEFSQEQLFTIKIPVATVPEEYTPDRLRTRVLEDEILVADSFADAILTSQENITPLLNGEESFWPEPLNYKNEEANFPAIFRWLIYKEAEADKLFLAELESSYVKNEDYLFDSIQKNRIIATENENIYYFEADIKVYTK